MPEEKKEPLLELLEGGIVIDPDLASRTPCTCVRTDSKEICVHPSTFIGAVPQPAPISQNDSKLLYTSEGLANPSAKTVRQYSGELVGLVPCYTNIPLYLSPNHPIYARKVKNNRTEDGRNHYYIPTGSKPAWIEAGAIEPGDLIFYPSVKGPAFDLDRDMASFLGYYLAEGYACVNKGGGSFLEFSFHENEVGYAKEVKDLGESLFNLKAHISHNPTYKTKTVKFYSKGLAFLFHALFGSKSEEKRIPGELLFAGSKSLWHLYASYYRGDGQVKTRSSKQPFSTVTSSRVLAYQLRDIAIKLGFLIGMKKDQNSYRQHVPQIYHDLLSKHLNVDLPEPKTRYITPVRWLRRIDETEDGIWVKIREVKRVKYIGDLMNFSVPGVENYVAEGILVHNCWSPGIIGALSPSQRGPVGEPGPYCTSKVYETSTGLEERIKRFREAVKECEGVTGPERWKCLSEAFKKHGVEV
jgi:hypothetical protein